MGRPRPTGRITNNAPDGVGWIWHSAPMRHTLTFRALGIHARRVLDFLEQEQMAHGGQENGNLVATYQQLAAWGVTQGDIRKGFAELMAGGFVRLTHQGACVAGGGDASRYCLTWLPTRGRGSAIDAPTDDWSAVAASLLRSGMTTVAEARAWLKAETGGGRSTAPRSDPHPRY